MSKCSECLASGYHDRYYALVELGFKPLGKRPTDLLLKIRRDYYDGVEEELQAKMGKKLHLIHYYNVTKKEVEKLRSRTGGRPVYYYDQGESHIVAWTGTQDEFIAKLRSIEKANQSKDPRMRKLRPHVEQKFIEYLKKHVRVVRNRYILKKDLQKVTLLYHDWQLGLVVEPMG